MAGGAEEWLDSLPGAEKYTLNNPETIWRRWNREFGIDDKDDDKEKKPRQTKAAKQQEANLALQKNLDEFYKMLEVETPEQARDRLGKLINEGVVLRVAAAPELLEEAKRLERELDTAKRGVRNTTDELQKTKQQWEKQSGTLARALELVNTFASEPNSNPAAR